MPGCFGQVWYSVIKVFTIGEKSENEKYIVLQPEIWNKILLKLWESEEDLEALLICRLVCDSWKKLIDKMPPKPHWNPWLRIDMRAWDILERVPATNFKNYEDIRQFSSLIAKLSPDEAEKNPFRNKTVKLFDHRYQKCSIEMEKLLKILDEHGHHIHQLYCHPTQDVEVLLRAPLLPKMSNLRTLVLNFFYMPRKESSLNEEHFPKDLENLQELVIIGEEIPTIRKVIDNRYGRAIRICKRFSVYYGSQIKSFTLAMWSPDIQNSIFERYPNLEAFKVESLYFPDHFTFPFEPFPISWPKLKRLALGTVLTENSFEFVKVLNIVCRLSGTLQLLSWNLKPAEGLGSEVASVVVEVPNQPPTNSFPKLEKLILPFRFMFDNGRSNFGPLETRLRIRLPFLKYIVLEDLEDRFKNKKISEAELSEICSQMWPLLPSSVETVSLRVLRTNDVLKRDFPVIYKCHRDSTFVGF